MTCRHAKGAPTSKGIGIFDRSGTHSNDRALKNHRQAADRIRQWAQQKDIDTVIWTAIGPRFFERTGMPFSVDAAIHYLDRLAEPAKSLALEYIRNAPPEVVTPIRTKVEASFP